MPFEVGDFSTVPEELLTVALRYGDYLESEGYAVEIEPLELAQPSTPVFRATRGLTTVFAHVVRRPDIDEILDWAQYARTFDKDTRLYLVIPGTETIPTSQMSRLTKAQVGIVAVDGQDVQLLCSAADLTVNLAIPRLPPGVHAFLGDAWDLIREGKWMEGFDEACQVLNRLAASHLVKKINAGTVSFVTPAGKPKALTVAEIERAPLGAIREYFSWIEKPGTIETTVEGVIGEINANRVTVAHFKREPDRQEALRAKVARQTFMVLNAVKLLV